MDTQTDSTATPTGWAYLRERAGVPTEMVRRDALCIGDRAISSHYGLRTVKSVAQFGTEGQTTHIIWEGGTPEYILSERYDSDMEIPRVSYPAAIVPGAQVRVGNHPEVGVVQSVARHGSSDAPMSAVILWPSEHNLLSTHMVARLVVV